MMGKTRWMTGSLVALGLMLGSVSAAEARPRYDRGWGHHHRDRGNGFGFGDAVGVAALIGAVAIVASSLSKDKQAARGSAPYANDDAPPPATGTDYGLDRQGAAPGEEDFSDVVGNPDAMADACALAARDEAQNREGGYAEIRAMDEPRPIQGGYNIDGEIETRASYGASTGTIRRFTCVMQNGRVAEVYLSRDVAMR